PRRLEPLDGLAAGDKEATRLVDFVLGEKLGNVQLGLAGACIHGLQQSMAIQKHATGLQQRRARIGGEAHFDLGPSAEIAVEIDWPGTTPEPLFALQIQHFYDVLILIGNIEGEETAVGRKAIVREARRLQLPPHLLLAHLPNARVRLLNFATE